MTIDESDFVTDFTVSIDGKNADGAFDLQYDKFFWYIWY